LTTILLLCGHSAALSVIFFLKYNSKLRELLDLQFQVTLVNQRNAGINQLMNESRVQQAHPKTVILTAYLNPLD